MVPLRQESKKLPGLSNAANTPNKTRVGTCPGPKQRSTDDDPDRSCAHEQTGMDSEEHQMRNGGGRNRQIVVLALKTMLPQAKST